MQFTIAVQKFITDKSKPGNVPIYRALIFRQDMEVSACVRGRGSNCEYYGDAKLVHQCYLICYVYVYTHITCQNPTQTRRVQKEEKTTNIKLREWNLEEHPLMQKEGQQSWQGVLSVVPNSSHYKMKVHNVDSRVCIVCSQTSTNVWFNSVWNISPFGSQ